MSFMLSVIMLNVIMLNVVMLSVVAPFIPLAALRLYGEATVCHAFGHRIWCRDTLMLTFSITTLSIPGLNATLSKNDTENNVLLSVKMFYGTTALSIITLNIMTLSITTFSITINKMRHLA